MKNLSLLALLIALFLMAILMAGCGGGSSKLTPSTNVPAGGTLVATDLDVSQALTLDAVRAIKAGTMLKIRVNRFGTEVRDYAVQFDGVVEDPVEPLIAFTVTNTALIVGAGDSGSPLLTSDGKIIGNLRYQAGDANFLAAPVNDVMKAGAAEGSTRTTRSYRGQTYNLIAVSMVASGFSGNLLKACKLDGKFNATSSALAVVQRNAGRGTTVKPIAGQSVIVYDVYGDLAWAGAIGTACFNKDGLTYIFGHRYNDEGATAIPAELAYLVQMPNTVGWGASKLAYSTGQSIGTDVFDRYNGNVIDPNAVAKTIAVTTNLVLNGDASHLYHHFVTVHNRKFGEDYYEQAALVQPLDYRLDGSYSGTVTGTLAVVLADGSTVTENVAVPDDGSSASADLVYDTARVIGNYLRADLITNESPVSLTLTIQVTATQQ